jgi:uncharacterized protein DUF4124
MTSIKKLTRYCAALFVVLYAATNANAEIYKWVDKSGNTHFGDRPPQDQAAQAMESKLKPLNLSTDLADHNMLIEAEKQRRQAGKSNSPARTISEQQDVINQWCKEAKVRLEKMRGPVVFMDDDGKEVKVSEKERQQREVELTKEIAKEC